MNRNMVGSEGDGKISIAFGAVVDDAVAADEDDILIILAVQKKSNINHK